MKKLLVFSYFINIFSVFLYSCDSRPGMHSLSRRLSVYPCHCFSAKSFPRLTGWDSNPWPTLRRSDALMIFSNPSPHLSYKVWKYSTVYSRCCCYTVSNIARNFILSRNYLLDFLKLKTLTCENCAYKFVFLENLHYVRFTTSVFDLFIYRSILGYNFQ